MQPNRTMALRGFDGLGASAALHSATNDSFEVSGTFRDAADFAVLVLYDADNFYEHPRLKYLPDFRFTGAALTFDVRYGAGLQPLDSPKYNWIDWATLDCIREDGTSARVRLWDHCRLQAGTFPAASGTFHVTTGDGGIEAFDRLTVFFQNLAYDYIAPPVTLSVEYQFFAAGTGTVHSITVGGQTYSHVETKLAGESSAEQAEALVAAMEGDGSVTAAIGSVPYSVLLTIRPGRSAAVAATGNTAIFLSAQPRPEDVAEVLAAQIDSTDWWTAAPVHALRAKAGGEAITVTAARYGTVAVTGTQVRWVSGAAFTGLAAGDRFLLAGGEVTVASVESSFSLTLTAPANDSREARYVADRGGVDGNAIELYALSKTGTLATRENAVRLSGGASDATWRCSLDFSTLQIDRLRQCWLTFAPALANGAAFSTLEWQAWFSNWTLSDPNQVCGLSVAGPGSVRIEERSRNCRYTGAWASEAPETGFYSGGTARRAGSTSEQLTVTYTCGKVHDLYLGTSLYSDRATVGIRLDGDAETALNCALGSADAVITRRPIRLGVAAGSHTMTLRLVSAGYFYFDFLEAAVLADVPDSPQARADISPALDYSTDHSYKLPPARILWMFDKLGFTGPVNQYIGVFWWNQRVNRTARCPSLTVTFGGTWADGEAVKLNLSGTAIWKTVFPSDTTATVAAHFARYINEVFVGAWAKAEGAVLTVQTRSPAYSFTFSSSLQSAAGTATVEGTLSSGEMGTWEVDPVQTPALNRGARDWHADLYAECRLRNREVVTAGSMELVNPPDGFPALFADGTPVITDVGFDHLHSTHCAQSSGMRAYQTAMFDCITDLQNAAGLIPNIQFGEYLWWFFSKGDNKFPGMAFYDGETAAAAQAALGRPLYRFLAPTDDPSVNGWADANFLRARLRDHVAAIAQHVKARYPAAQCEMLFAYDVNYPTVQNGVGGRLNRYLNFPPEWGSSATAGFERLKVEALSFGGNSRNLDLARDAVAFGPAQQWPLERLRYLVPIFVPSSTWEKELAMALGRRIPVVNLWAFDQLCIFGLKISAQRNQARSARFP